MGRALLIILLVFNLKLLLAQSISGSVKDERGEPIYDVRVSCVHHHVFTDIHGKFHFKECTADSLVFDHSLYQTVKIKVTKEPIEINLKLKVTELVETQVIQKRLNNFDIGYLPPVKGVQIATGTSSIIQTEGQQGAKSTGNPRELFAKVPDNAKVAVTIRSPLV